jgi:DNA-binding response OmpR family regulator
LEHQRGTGAPAHLSFAAGSETILLVSRDIDSRILIRNTFFHRGYLVLEAADEQQAALVWSQMQCDIDLIIVDASPTQIVSWGQWHQRIPKLFILLDAADAQLDAAPTDAEMEYLTKPLIAEETALKVRLVLNRHKQQKKVLIVDDDESVRRMLAALLEASGYEVAQASNGREALNRADTLEADIILTEIVMPEMEGLQLIQELLQLNPGLRIIAMSGADRAESYLATAKSLGAKATLTKPLTAGELLQTLREVSHRH